ncbi:MAG: hypothetical protein M3Z04_20210 [Chloroflexota bacterium]|nr:hypothetical protein [Chloroflexota bacterium]
MKQIYSPTALRTTGFLPVQAETKPPLRQVLGTSYSSADGATTPATSADQAWFWTPAWQAAEQEVDEHIQAGRVERFTSIDDFLATL